MFARVVRASVRDTVIAMGVVFLLRLGDIAWGGSDILAVEVVLFLAVVLAVLVEVGLLVVRYTPERIAVLVDDELRSRALVLSALEFGPLDTPAAAWLRARAGLVVSSRSPAALFPVSVPPLFLVALLGISAVLLAPIDAWRHGGWGVVVIDGDTPRGSVRSGGEEDVGKGGATGQERQLVVRRVSGEGMPGSPRPDSGVPPALRRAIEEAMARKSVEPLAQSLRASFAAGSASRKTERMLRMRLLRALSESKGGDDGEVEMLRKLLKLMRSAGASRVGVAPGASDRTAAVVDVAGAWKKGAVAGVESVPARYSVVVARYFSLLGRE